MELEPARTPTGSAHSRAGPRHYLIAAHAHWLVPPEAGPLRRSALTLPARGLSLGRATCPRGPTQLSGSTGHRDRERYLGGRACGQRAQ